jgi:RHH-type proline utilization regulon transcriptional repressor/proline dehydrogenase/delta 1-pyrroline-5-carboxylate dehydrogenase
MKADDPIAAALTDFTPDPDSKRPEAVQKAVYLARRLQQRADELMTPEERRHAEEIQKLIDDPADKSTLMQMTDEAFRSQRAKRAAEHLVHLLDTNGIPNFMGKFEKGLLEGF